MKSGAIPKNETERLKKLKSLDILDTLEEEAYDDLTLLAAQICDAPISLVSLVDQSRQWFKSHHGLDARETPREFAFCGHAIHQDDILIIEDTNLDERFKDNPLVINEPNIRFYAGAPLIFENDIRIGTLCVIDTKSRTLTQKQQLSLQALSRQVVAQLELRMQLMKMSAVDKAKDKFLSVVSHELRTPMTSVHSALKILEHESEKFDEPIQSMVHIASRNSDHLLKIVNDILDLSSMRAGMLKIHSSKVDLIQLVKNAIELNQAYINKFECEAEFNFPKNVTAVLVNGDEQRLLQVAANLISNAAKFSNKAGKIVIALDIESGDVTFSVTDFGAGISLENQERLFKKFQRLGCDTNQHQPGTGLGLIITKHILEAHGSKVEFRSLPNKETKFYFKLPLLSQA